MGDTVVKEYMSDTNNAIAKYYAENFKHYGIDPISVGWESKQVQDLRFQILLDIIDQRKKDIKINDLGCGYGALYDFIVAQKIPISMYYGYDICKDMIDKAREKSNGSRSAFFCKAKTSKVADYSFISGTFNIKFDTDKDLWTEYIKESLISIAKNTRCGLAFNLLSSHVEIQDDKFYYGRASDFFDFCMKNISDRIVLRHDYSDIEWSMLIYF